MDNQLYNTTGNTHIKVECEAQQGRHFNDGPPAPQNDASEAQTLENKFDQLTPPQPSVLARSFPVPSGRMAIGGWGIISRVSKWDRIQPTVPSPPQAKIRRFGTFLYKSRLQTKKNAKVCIFILKYYNFCLMAQTLQIYIFLFKFKHFENIPVNETLSDGKSTEIVHLTGLVHPSWVCIHVFVSCV